MGKPKFSKRLVRYIFVAHTLVASILTVALLVGKSQIHDYQKLSIIIMVYLFVSETPVFVLYKMMKQQGESFNYQILSNFSKAILNDEYQSDELDLYLRLSDVSNEVSYEYNITHDRLVLYGNYHEVFPDYIPHRTEGFLKKIMNVDVIHENYRDVFKSNMNYLALKGGSQNFECLAKTKEGEYEWFLFSMSYFKDNEEYVIGTVRNIHEQASMIVDLRNLASTDSFTGLYNKVTTEELINEEASYGNYKAPGYFLIVDIDDFKHFNDNYGHVMGDEIILDIATILKKTFRKDDIIGRVGGDEFVVYMRRVESRHIVEERITELMHALESNNKKYNFINADDEVTLSIGICENKVASTYEELCTNADKALYTIKAKGKNSFAWFSKSLPKPLVVYSSKEKVENIHEIAFEVQKMRLRNRNYSDIFRYFGESYNINQIILYCKNPSGTELELIADYISDETKRYQTRPTIEGLEALGFDETGLMYRDISDDKGEEISLLCLQIKYHDEVLGYMMIIDYVGKHQWTKDEIDSIRIVLNTIAYEMHAYTLSRKLEQINFLRPINEKAIEIAELTLKSDKMVISQCENGKVIGTKIVNYEDYYNQNYEEIDVSHREAYKAIFLKKNLLKLVKEGQKEIYVDYGKLIDDKHHFFRSIMRFMHDRKTGTVISIQTSVLDEDIKSKLESKSYFDALTLIYKDIYRLDLRTMNYFCLYREHKEFNGNLSLKYTDEYIEGVAHKYVATFDQQNFIDFASPQRIIEASQKYEMLSLDYHIVTPNGLKPVHSKIIFNGYDRKTCNIYVQEMEEHSENAKNKEALRESSLRLEKHWQSFSKQNFGLFYTWNVEDDTITYLDRNISAKVVPLSEFVSWIMPYAIDRTSKDKIINFFKRSTVNGIKARGENTISLSLNMKENDVIYVVGIDLYVYDDSNVVDILIKDNSEKYRIEELKILNTELTERNQINERFRIIAEHTGTLTCEWNPSEGIVFFDKRLMELYPCPYETRGSDFLKLWIEHDYIHPEDIPLLENFRKGMLETPYVEITLRIKQLDGKYRYTQLAASFIRDDNNNLIRAIATINDVDEVVRANMNLKYRAEYDELTGLYNYNTFITATSELLLDNMDAKYAVIQFDIDRFKLINDIYGREHGDKVIRYIADIIKGCLTTYDTFGRMNSDVFVMCVRYVEEDDLVSLIEYISEQIEEFPTSYKLVASFGIYKCDDHEIPVHNMVDRANLALKKIKGSYLHRYHFYDDILRNEIVIEKNLESEMEQALANRQFHVYLQPKVDINSRKIVGAEALVRWIHPVRGMISPGEFIPLFEKNGFIVELDNFVWREACRILSEWNRDGKTVVPISVNISRMNTYSGAFVERLCGLTKEYNVDRSLIELELTESVFLENTAEIYADMGELRNRGFHISMDDFGSGYSSLNMLRSVPIDILKIDRQFFDEKDMSSSGEIIVESTIELAHRLNLKVVAEGVESEEMCEFLAKIGCDVGQGYLFSKPVPVNEFEQLLAENH